MKEIIEIHSDSSLKAIILKGKLSPVIEQLKKCGFSENKGAFYNWAGEQRDGYIMRFNSTEEMQNKLYKLVVWMKEKNFMMKNGGFAEINEVFTAFATGAGWVEKTPKVAKQVKANPSLYAYEVHHITDGKVFETNSEAVASDYIEEANDPREYFIHNN